MDRYWNPNAETMARDAVRILQNERLRRTLRHAKANSPFYAQRIEAAGIDCDAFLDIEVLERLPLLTHGEISAKYPLGLLCVPQKAVREVHTSYSASSPLRIVIPYTVSDLRQWAHCMARCYVMAGAEEGDVVQILPSLGLLSGGFGFYHGARLAELFILPVGGGDAERQLRLASTFGTRIFGACADMAPQLAEAAERMGGKFPALKVGIFGGGLVPGPERERLRAALGIDCFDVCGMTETGGGGTMGMDCRVHEGIHVWEDHYYVEIVEPGSGRVLPDGEEGELVVTTLTREALPLIRYRTGDRTRILSRAPCACGRTHLRIAQVGSGCATSATETGSPSRDA